MQEKNEAQEPRRAKILLAFPGRAAKMSKNSWSEVRMLWKKVTKVAATAGSAEGATPLNAFDNALLAAGIGNINLIKVSSIVPPHVSIIALPKIKPGALVRRA